MIIRLLVFSLLLIGLAGSVYPAESVQSKAPTEDLRVLAAAPSMRVGFPKEGAGNIYFASPAAIDLDGDGRLELLTAGGLGCVFAWRDNGQVVAGYPLPVSGAACSATRISGPIAAADIDLDGSPEIAVGSRGSGTIPGSLGKVFVWRANGALIPGWPREMEWNSQYGDGGAEVYSVAMGRVVNLPDWQIAAGTSNNAALSSDLNQPAPNLHLWQADGTVIPGFPTGYKGAGIWGHIGLGNVIGDGLAEVFAGRDHLYLHGYSGSGAYLAGYPLKTYIDIQKTTWGVDSYLEFTRNAPSIGDIDRDGVAEIAIVGVVRDPLQGHQQVNSGLIVVNAGGARKPGWESAKLANGILWNTNPPSQAPALADLDGDGNLEIVVTMSDGTARAYRSNGSLMWSYNFAQGNILHASEPVIGDVTGDGWADVLFGTYTPNGSITTPVGLIGLDRGGNPLTGFPLALPNESGDLRGLRAAPTLAELDGDCKVEIIAASQKGWLYVWNTGATYYWNRMPWFTSRHDNARSGSSDGPTPPPSRCPLFNLQPKAYLPEIHR